MEVAILRLLHITFGTLWVGGAFLVGIFLIPAMAEAGPGGGAVMAGVVKRKLPIWINLFAVISVLCGLRLFMVNAGNNPGYGGTPTGICISLGALFALAGFVIGVVVQRPAAMQIAALSEAIKAAGGPPTAEQQAEMKRLGGVMGKAAKRNAIFLLHAVVFMAASRLAGQF